MKKVTLDSARHPKKAELISGRREPADMVVLLSNNPHYYYAARALLGAGILRQYITSWCLLDGEQPPFYLPDLYRRKLNGRRHAGLPPNLVTKLHAPEFLQKTLPRLRLTSSAAATNVNNWLFDSLSAKILPSFQPWSILHIINTIGLKCAQQARRNGAVVVYDSRQEHPVVQDRAVEDEARRRGLPRMPADKALGRRMLKELAFADHVIVPSRYASRSFTEHGINPQRVHVVPYGVDTSLFTWREHNRGQKLRLLFVGGMSLRKGVLNLLEALRRLKSASVQLTCIGNVEPGIETALGTYSDLFTHTATIPKIDLPRLYSQADLLILPSIADAYPLVVLEALACGLPVITTSSVGSADILREGVDGFIVKPGEVDVLARTIGKFLDDPCLAPQMSANTKAHASNLDWSRYESDLQGLYANTLLSAAGSN